MATRQTSSFDAEMIDNTLLSIPEVYTAYVHPALIITLRLGGSALLYCLVGLTNILVMVLKTILYPVYAIGHLFIVRPFGFFLHLCHLLYPVAVYLSFAVLCGLVIGGCAGFTAEALSSFFINATWGRSSSKEKHHMDTLSDVDDADSNDDDYDSDMNDYEEDEHEAPQPHRFSAISSSLVSIWKGAPELEKDSDLEEDHSDDGDLNFKGRRSPVMYSSMASKDKHMTAKGKQAMRNLDFMTTTHHDNTPRYRIGKKTLDYDTE